MTVADVTTAVCAFALTLLVGELRWTIRRAITRLDDHQNRITRLEVLEEIKKR